MGCGASTAQVPPRQLVLLGGGECGKTTIFKQIQLLHGSGFSDEVRSDWVSAVSASPLRSMRVLLTKADELGLPVNEVNATAATRRRTGGWLQRWAVTDLGGCMLSAICAQHHSHGAAAAECRRPRALLAAGL